MIIKPVFDIKCEDCVHGSKQSGGFILCSVPEGGCYKFREAEIPPQTNGERFLTIVRGFPGSGKTTFGRKLAAKQNGLFVEPDMFLYDGNGRYNYLPSDFLCAIHSAHDILDAYFKAGGMFAVYTDVLPTIESVRSFVEEQKSMIRTILFDINYKVVDMPKITYEKAKIQNVHNVCEEDLKRMFEQWEDWK